MSRDYATLCTVVSRLADHIDAVDEVADAASMLQHCFVMVFKPPLPTSAVQSPEGTTGMPSTAELASDEELKLLLVEAIRAFHVNGRHRHAAFMQAEPYHTQAALYIHELLTALRGGNARPSFRQLQLASVQAMEAVVLAIGPANVRRCLPGIVSVISRYLQRAHRGKDSVAVRVAAVALLRHALAIALGASDASCDAGNSDSVGNSVDAAWVGETVVRLHTVLQPLLDPDQLTEASHDTTTLAALAHLFADLVATSVMRERAAHPFMHALIVAYCIVANLYTLQSRAQTDQPALAPLPSSVYAPDVAACQAVRHALWKLRGAPLLHLATTALRLRELEPALLATDEPGVTLFSSVLRRCIGLVGTGMEPEALYTFRTPRRHPSGVVDEFLDHLAHRLAALPPSHGGDEEGDAETSGERLTNVMLDMCEAVLQDWDLYALHPSTLYVLARAVLWQFAPRVKSDSVPDQCCDYPAPEELVESGAFDQLWSIMGAPHLWNITQDEDLCSTQQIHHRQVVAATILRALALAASDVMAHCGSSAAAQHSMQRFLTRTVYLVMEKAAAAEPVHEAAMRCLRAFAEAVQATTAKRAGDEAGEDAVAVAAASSELTFFFRVSGLVVDEAARAVTVSFLRPAAASVLRGAVAFLTHATDSAAATGDGVVMGGGSGGWFDSALVATMRQRLRSAAVREAVRRYDAMREPGRLDRMADFVAAVIAVAGDGCERAKREEVMMTRAAAGSANSCTSGGDGDVTGVRAALAVLRDCFDLAALLHFASPPRALDEEKEDDTLQQLTAAEPHVQRLQLVVRDAVHAVLRCCSRVDAATPSVVQAVLRGLTVFLTTAEAATWAARARSAAESAQEDGMAAPQPSLPSLRWWDESSEAVADEKHAIQLPRSHLRTVYRVYLSLFAMLREPLSVFAGDSARGAVERRQLEQVSISPGIFALLVGMESLQLLATDFLAHRMVDEVLPIVLLWYQRATAPRVRTHNEERLQRTVREYVEHCLQLYPAPLLRKARDMCAPYFTLADDEAAVGDAPYQPVVL